MNSFGGDNSFRQLNRDLFNMINTADVGRYGKFSYFLYTLFIFGLGILFSIFIGVSRGKSSKELTDLISKIHGQKGRYEKAKQQYLKLESWLYRIKAVEKLYYTFAIVLALCMYKSRDLMTFILHDKATITIPFTVASVLVLRMAVGHYETRYRKTKKQL